MDDRLYQELLANPSEPEPFVRRALRLLEADFRESALLALSDWERLEIVAPELFLALATLQRPSWGMWNGLFAALRNGRKAVLRTGVAADRARIEAAGPLNFVLSVLDEAADPELVSVIRPLGDLLRVRVIDRPRLALALTLPITLRNRVAHDSPDDPGWWVRAAGALRALIKVHADGRLRLTSATPPPWPSPWFVEDEGELWSFNGVYGEAVVYVARGGSSRIDPTRLPEVLLAFQRLLGRAESQVQDVRRLLARLAPEEIKGVILGDYLVGRPVGSGGFATVHVGRQLSTGRKVAVKILHDGLSEEDRLRFRQEAAYLSRFNNPGIVGVVEYGEEVWSAPRQFSLAEEPWFATFSRSAAVRTFIALEWVDGETLEQLYRKLPGERPILGVLAGWLNEAAAALHAVHAIGLLHRDVKPSNLMVTAEGRLKLMDFGIARGQGELRTLVTATGRIFGTLAYMAPEQVRAADAASEIGPAADIYALCATFYELFTGARLFGHDTETVESIAARKLNRERAENPLRLARDLPWEVATILMGGLEPEASDRYQSAADLARDVQHFLADEPIEYRRPSLGRRALLFYRRNRGVANVVAVFVSVAILGVTQYILAIRAEQERTQAQAREVTHRLDRSYVADGVRRWTEGDWLGSLPWLGESLRLSVPGTAREEAHRVRIGQVLGLSPHPAHAWFHQKMVNAVAFSPDGRLAATGSGDLTARVWNVTDGSPVSGPLEHDDPVLKVIFSPDGSRLLTTSGDTSGRNGPGEARLWDFRTGVMIVKLRHREKPAGAKPGPAPSTDYVIRNVGLILAAEFRPDGQAIATASDDGTARLWDAASGQPIGEPMAHSGPVTALAFRPDGELLVTAEDRKIHLWDPRRATPTANSVTIDDAVHQLAFSPVGSRLAAAAGREIVVFNVGKPRQRLTLQESGDRVQFAFSPDGERIAVVGDEGFARIWGLKEAKWLTPRLPHPGARSAAFGPDGRLLLTAGDRARLWDSGTGQPASPWLTHSGEVAAFSPEGRQVATVQGDAVTLWNLAPRGELTLPPPPGWEWHSMRSSRDGRRLILSANGRTREGGYLGEARVWDVEGNIPLTPPMRHQGSIFFAAFGARDRLVVTASEGPDSKDQSPRKGEARVWDASTGRPITSPLQHDGPVHHAAISPDGRLVASSGDDRVVRLWEVATGRALFNLPHEFPATFAAFSEDGRGLLTAASPNGPANRGEVRLWDVATGKPRSPVLPLDGEILRAELTPDASRVLTISRGWIGGHSPTHARLWDASTGRMLIGPIAVDEVEPRFRSDGSRLLLGDRSYDPRTGDEIHAFEGRVLDAVWPPSGRPVAVTAMDNQARIRDAETGATLSPPLVHPGEVIRARLTADGLHLATLCKRADAQGRSDDAEIHLWDVSTGEPLAPPTSLKINLNLLTLTLSPDGSRLLAFGHVPGHATLFRRDLLADHRPIALLEELGHRASGRAIDATGGAVAVDLRAAWGDQARPSAPGPLPAEDAVRWDRAEASTAWAGRDDFAALWHLDRLAAIGAATAEDRERRALSLLRLERWDAAASAFEALTRPGPAESRVWAGRADALARLHRWGEAVEAYTRAIEGGRAVEDVWLGRAIALAETGRPDEASRDLETAFSSWSNQLVEQHLGPEVTRLEEDGAWEAVVSVVGRLLEVPFLSGIRGSFRRPGALAHRANALAKLGRFPQAIADYTAAIGAEPGVAWYWRGRAAALEAVGQVSEAEADRRKADELTPEKARDGDP